MGLVACAGTSTLVHSARNGEHATLRRDLAPRLAAATLGRAESRELALATLERELTTAEGEQAERRVLEAEACVHQAARALRLRSQRRDRAAAEAMLVLYEAGELPEHEARAHTEDRDPAFVRVGVRALDRKEDHERRAAYLTDSDGALRAQAARAAMIADDARDMPLLKERARLDPEREVRSFAVRALALLPDPPRELVSFFIERMAVEESESIRGDLAVGLALSPMFERGGREELTRLLSSTTAKPSAEERALIALLVMRTRTNETGLRGLAEQVLLTSLQSAPQPVRVLIVRAAPLSSAPLRDAVAAIAKAEGAGSELGQAALESLAHVPGSADGKSVLYEAAKVDGVLGSRARQVLARLGDERVQAWLEHDLESADSVRRLGAARGLAALHRAGRAAILLADSDPSVRTRAACVIASDREHERAD